MEAASPTYVDLYGKVVVSGVFPSELKKAVCFSQRHSNGSSWNIAPEKHLCDTSFFSLWHMVQNL